MDYEKKYKDALEKARDYYEKGYFMINAALENILPELKESEDERIRKELLEHCKNQAKPYIQTGNKCPQIQSWIAWLEKQKVLTTEEYLQGKEDVLWCIKQAKKYATDENEMGTCWFAEKWLEKQGEQKPTDKVEPKFHKEEWLIENHPNNYARFVQILEIVNVQGKDGYRISRDLHNDEDIVECRFIEDNWHSFNIKDAKDGDVLYSIDSKQPFIYKERPQFSQAIGYCCINIFGEFAIWNTSKCVICTDKYIPATKEQRDTLLKAMADAGYTFDFEKRELKKIEQKPEWSEEEYISYILTNCMNYAEKMGYVEEKNNRYIHQNAKLWLKSLKDRYTWKPSNEQMNTLEYYMHTLVCNEHKEILFGLYTDLKKLSEE